ncbi:MAG TPA: branched-chain amino acid aminotransferase [Cyclobacteriaceae bacterium]|nr:branched-chain amino acid aminotransferase [Cyclobacteriaceae bacterium]
MMTSVDSISIQRVGKSRLTETDFNNLEFGKYISDHMLVADWNNGAWSEPSIVPFGDIKITPASMALHYGQSVFEGMKAFKMRDDKISIFRIKKHHERLNKSLDRMCMPQVPLEMFAHCLRALVDVDREWIPRSEGASLYLRPLVFASESRLGVKVADQYKFVILTSPAGPFHVKSFKLKVEDRFVRTAEGGTGFAKCAGNYGGAFYPLQAAKSEGFDQVLWTDHKEHRYVDEAGMMNVFFVLNGQLVTPQLNSAILDGVTRDCVLTLARAAGIPVEERKISLDELKAGFKNKTLTEAFVAGTAAAVVPISMIHIHGENYQFPAVSDQSVQLMMKQNLFDIRTGVIPDEYGWNYVFAPEQAAAHRPNLRF